MKKRLLGLTIIILSLILLQYTAFAELQKSYPIHKINPQCFKGISIIVTTDWEGLDLADYNISAMKDFRNKYPEIPIVQFLNAAYYTKNNADKTTITEKINSVLSPTDEIGLHIHGWKSLVEIAGVDYISQPTFLADISQIYYDDPGFDVPITVYNKVQLKDMITESLNILNQNGFRNIKSFRSGAWMMDDELIKALIETGFKYEHSAVPTSVLSEELNCTSVLEWLNTIWKGINIDTQPYNIYCGNKYITEIPDNGALADYITSDEMTAQFNQFADKYKSNHNKQYIMSIGFHEESAYYYLPSLDLAISQIIDTAKKEKIPLRFITSDKLRLHTPTKCSNLRIVKK